MTKINTFRAFAQVVAALALLSGGLEPARGSDEPLARTHWQCWWDQQQSAACMLLQAPAVAAISAREAAAFDRGTGVTAVALGQRPAALPASVKMLRERPGALRSRIVVVPLHNTPTDHRLVGGLVQMVMCGQQADCRADYSEHPGVTQRPQAMAAFADLNDPLLDVGE